MHLTMFIMFNFYYLLSMYFKFLSFRNIMLNLFNCDT